MEKERKVLPYVRIPTDKRGSDDGDRHCLAITVIPVSGKNFQRRLNLGLKLRYDEKHDIYILIVTDDLLIRY